MYKMILKQLWNERKGNLFIWLEMLVVSIFLWYAADALFVMYRLYSQPLGFNIEHTYHVSFGVIPEESPDYDTTSVHSERGGGDYLTLMDRIRRNPSVESICFTTGVHRLRPAECPARRGGNLLVSYATKERRDRPPHGDGSHPQGHILAIGEGGLGATHHRFHPLCRHLRQPAAYGGDARLGDTARHGLTPVVRFRLLVCGDGCDDCRGNQFSVLPGHADASGGRLAAGMIRHGHLCSEMNRLLGSEPTVRE